MPLFAFRTKRHKRKGNTNQVQKRKVGLVSAVVVAIVFVVVDAAVAATAAVIVAAQLNVYNLYTDININLYSLNCMYSLLCANKTHTHIQMQGERQREWERVRVGESFSQLYWFQRNAQRNLCLSPQNIQYTLRFCCCCCCCCRNTHSNTSINALVPFINTHIVNKAILLFPFLHNVFFWIRNNTHLKKTEQLNE